MRTLPANLSTKLASGDTTALCRLFTVTQADETVTYFTDAQQAVTISGQAYSPAAGVRVGALQLRANEASGSLTLTVAAVDAGTIGFDDLLRGAYDNAELRFYVADHSDPDDERLEIWRGWFTRVEMTERGEARVEVNGLLHKARYFITEEYSPVCRAQFGDARCGVNLATYTRTGTVTTASGYQVTIALDSAAPTGGFALGSIVATSGANVGRGVEVRSWDNGTSTATCFVQPSLAFQIGDTVEIIAGCDYTTGAAGCGKYSNILNFRGEPFVPGQDAVAAGYAVWTGDGSDVAPGGIVTGSGGLRVIATTSSTLSLAFSDYGPADQYSYQYRLDGGAAIALPSNKIISSGLEPETTYSIQVRPVNAYGIVGDWSNVAIGTTLEASGDAMRIVIDFDAWTGSLPQPDSIQYYVELTATYEGGSASVEVWNPRASGQEEEASLGGQIVLERPGYSDETLGGGYNLDEGAQALVYIDRLRAVYPTFTGFTAALYAERYSNPGQSASDLTISGELWGGGTWTEETETEGGMPNYFVNSGGSIAETVTINVDAGDLPAVNTGFALIATFTWVESTNTLSVA